MVAKMSVSKEFVEAAEIEASVGLGMSREHVETHDRAVEKLKPPPAFVGQAEKSPPTVSMTYSGVLFDIAAPDPVKVSIEDVAHHLSRENRYGGATICEHYSVAEHSVLVAEEAARLAWEWWKGQVKEREPNRVRFIPRPDWIAHVGLQALMHDAAEAYCKDLPRPLKQAIGKPYSLIYQRVEFAIQRAFDLYVPEWMECPASAWERFPEFIHLADERVLRREAMQIMHQNSNQWDWRRVGDDGKFTIVKPIEAELKCLTPNAAKAEFLQAWAKWRKAAGYEAT